MDDEFENCAIIDPLGYILSIGYGFHICTSLTIGDSIFDHIDTRFGDVFNFKLKLSDSNERLPIETNPLMQQMLTSDGYKYLLVVSRYINDEKIKVLIPKTYINNRFNGNNQIKEKVAVTIPTYKPFSNNSKLMNSIDIDDELNESINTKALKVLIVDDSMAICRVTARLIEKSGNIADYEANPINVLNGTLDLQYYDIVILDIHMKDLSGNDLCVKVKKMVRSNTKFVAMSSDHSEELITSTMKAGFDM